MGNRLGSRSDRELGPELGVRRSSWRGVFRRKPAAAFLDYEGTSFNNYLQQKSSTLTSQTRSLRNSFEGFPLARNRSASTGDQLYPLLRKAERETYLTSSEEMSEHIYSNLEPSYESLHPVAASETLPTLSTTTRRLLFSTERQVSHNEEEALELAPEYICVPKDTFEENEKSVTFDESPHNYGYNRHPLGEGVERAKVVASSKPHVTFERGAEVGETKCLAKCMKRRVARGQEAIFLQPSDHLGSPARLHLGAPAGITSLESPAGRHPPTLSNVTSGAHLSTVNTLLGVSMGFNI